MALGDTMVGPLREFAATVATKSTPSVAAGSAEDRLRAPFEQLVAAAARELGLEAVCAGEAALPGGAGRPDFAVHCQGLLAGHAELKAPGTGADATRFRGRNRDQFRRFAALPNLLYSDGREWALYRDGKRVAGLVRLAGDLATAGAEAVAPEDADALAALLRDFLSWEPILPTTRHGHVDAPAFAAQLAPLCRLLRDDVAAALAREGSALALLATDWRELLFPDATDAQFADAYAQTVAFALLLGRAEGAEPLTLASAQATLADEHSLLSRALQVLTDDRVRADLAASLDLLTRVLAAVPPAMFASAQDPWLYFYEDFLAAYDPALRKDAGVYYTPLAVVRAQVRLTEDYLINRLDRPFGFADPGVATLDPAVGTGTYLLAVVAQAAARLEQRYGGGAVAAHADALGARLYGFERLAGPYAVSELRVTALLRALGASGRAQIYLTDTLESPNAEPSQLPLFMAPISEQRQRALRVKRDAPVIVCLGNPPYDRHEAAAADNGHRTGAWVRWGDPGDDAIFQDFARPVAEAGRGGALKNLYNLYVYFWRWGLWKVFEQGDRDAGGVVSFVTASSYLDGDAFAGMREHLRRICDEVWILDLGGEGRGATRSENVFAIQTPVAVAVAARRGKANPSEPAQLHYARVDGTRQQKLDRLDAVRGFADVAWQDCPSAWQAPFLPASAGRYFEWPLLADLFPWQHSGVQLKRTWPIAPTPATLTARWQALLGAEDRAVAFRETADRTITGRYAVAVANEADRTPLADLPADAPSPPIRRYAYRALDRQHILADGRLMSRPRPDLWRTHGERQIYLTSLLTKPLGSGPALAACADMPDLDHFSGRGAKDVIPLWRTANPAADADANLVPGLLDLLPRTAGTTRPSPEDFLAYVYGLLAHPAFAGRFRDQLPSRQLRVPITTDAALFTEVREVGARLLNLHTFGARFAPTGGPATLPPGAARCVRNVPTGPDDYPATFSHDAAAGVLHVGDGAFAPVAAAAYEFEISGLKVLQSWLRYRMRGGAGRQSSPLNALRTSSWPPEFTRELVELLWVLEGTVALQAEQAHLLEQVLASRCLMAVDLRPPPDELRRPPKPAAAMPTGLW